MRKTLVTAATFNPLEVEEIKLRPELRISTDDDDLILAGYIRSAVQAYEQFTGHVLCSSIWDLYLDEFPDEIELPAPLVNVTSVNYRDTAGTWQVMIATDYVVDIYNPIYGRVALAYGESWPSIYDEINSVRVRFVAGYADSGTIPETIKDGLILKIQELYDGTDRRAAYEACWIDDARLAI